MSEKIASVIINRTDVTQTFLSREALYETRKNENSPLKRIIEWFKDEQGKDFDISNIRIGKDDDDYSILYYRSGVRYKIADDGVVYVSGADADESFEQVEADLQLFVNSILCDELGASLSSVCYRASAVSRSSKHVERDDHRSTLMFGIER